MTYHGWDSHRRGGVFGASDDTERITQDDWDANRTAQYEQAVANHHAATGQVYDVADEHGAITPGDTTVPEYDFRCDMTPAPNGPPWNGFDTFLRRAVMVAGFIILWTVIVMGVLTGAAIFHAVNNITDPGAAVVTTGDNPPATVDVLPDGECIGEVPC